MSIYDELVAAEKARQASSQGGGAVQPQVTYTPDGIPRQPGYLNPNNLYDTGRPGEMNAEKNNGQGGKLPGWNYDTGAPMPGTQLGADGMYSFGGGGGGGGAGGLAGSPYYQQVLAAVNAASTGDAAARRSAIQQALIGFGLVPEGFADKYGDVDALTRSLAEKNTTSGISTRARLLQARSDAIRQFSRSLSARGLRRSGAKGYGLRRRQLEFDQGYSDALGKLLGYTGGLYSQFAGNEYQRQLSLANALAYASQNLGNFAPSGGGGGSSYGGYSYYPGATAPDYFANLSNLPENAWSYPSSGGSGGKFLAM